LERGDRVTDTAAAAQTLNPFLSLSFLDQNPFSLQFFSTTPIQFRKSSSITFHFHITVPLQIEFNSHCSFNHTRNIGIRATQRSQNQNRIQRKRRGSELQKEIKREKDSNELDRAHPCRSEPKQ